MPALPDSTPQITLTTGTGRPIHPSPRFDKLRLEILSPRELAYHGQQYGVDLPFDMYPMGWGEWEYLTGGDL